MVDRHIAQEIVSSYIDTGDGGKKHLAITSKGVIWFGMRHNGNLRLYAGASMTDPAYQAGDSGIANGVLTCAGEWSMVIDDLDNVHITYAKYAGASSDGRTDKASIMYRHGVLSASHTGITWSAEVAVTGYDYWHSPDVVAHYINGQIYAHVITAYNWAGDNRTIIHYWRCRTNSGDSVNHVAETSVFIHDVSGSQVFVPKPSIELRHDGDGKRAYKNPSTGLLEPDLFVTWTAFQDTYAARIPWTGSAWGTAQVWVVNPDWANTTLGGGYGGLYEHHRWTKMLYSRRDDRMIIVGWMALASVSRQAMLLFEIAARGATTQLVGMAFQGTAGTGPNMDWGLDSAAEAAVSCCATLDPQDNIEMFGSMNNYGAAWYSLTARRKILRPKGSNLRTVDVKETVFDGNVNGVHADILPYPPGGEHHTLMNHGNTWMYYWRNNRGCNFVHTGTVVGRRPKYRMHADGVTLVPVAERTYT